MRDELRAICAYPIALSCMRVLYIFHISSLIFFSLYSFSLALSFSLPPSLLLVPRPLFPLSPHPRIPSPPHLSFSHSPFLSFFFGLPLISLVSHLSHLLSLLTFSRKVSRKFVCLQTIFRDTFRGLSLLSYLSCLSLISCLSSLILHLSSLTSSRRLSSLISHLSSPRSLSLSFLFRPPSHPRLPAPPYHFLPSSSLPLSAHPLTPASLFLSLSLSLFLFWSPSHFSCLSSLLSLISHL